MQQTQFEPYEPMTLAPQDLDSGSSFKGQRAHLSYAFRCKFVVLFFYVLDSPKPDFKTIEIELISIA